MGSRWAARWWTSRCEQWDLTRWRCLGFFQFLAFNKLSWLVVWLPFVIFPYIGNNHPNWLSNFSEGLKPPTSKWWCRWYTSHRPSHLFLPIWDTIVKDKKCYTTGMKRATRCATQNKCPKWRLFTNVAPHWNRGNRGSKDHCHWTRQRNGT